MYFAGSENDFAVEKLILVGVKKIFCRDSCGPSYKLNNLYLQRDCPEATKQSFFLEWLCKFLIDCQHNFTLLLFKIFI